MISRMRLALRAGLQRDGGRHGGADPQIAFFQRGQELAAQARGQHADGEQEDDAGTQTLRACVSDQRSAGS
jgi:hypothetical protein